MISVLCGVQDFFGVSEFLSVCKKFFFFAFLKFRLFQLRNLIIQHVKFSFAGCGVADIFKLVAQFFVRIIRFLQFFLGFFNLFATESVQKMNVSRNFQKRLMLVLTVDIDKFFADTFQHSERNLRAIYSALVFVFRHRAL